MVRGMSPLVCCRGMSLLVCRGMKRRTAKHQRHTAVRGRMCTSSYSSDGDCGSSDGGLWVKCAAWLRISVGQVRCLAADKCGSSALPGSGRVVIGDQTRTVA